MDLMNHVFKTYLDKFMIVFIDDILIYSRSWEEHAEHLRTVLRTLVEHRLYAKFSKYEFWLDNVQFLGYVISKDGLSVDPAKNKVVSKWFAPTNVRNPKLSWIDWLLLEVCRRIIYLSSTTHCFNKEGLEV